MTSIQIRRVTGYELSQIRQSVPGYAFAGDTPPGISVLAMEQTATYLEDDHYFALFKDGDPVATAGNRPMTQNVRGKVVPMWGVWNVAVLPLARRKGYARDVMAHLLTDTRVEGGAFSTLYPFRESFYERMGYATFPQARKVLLKPENLSGVFDLPLEGDFDMRLYKDGYTDYMPMLKQLQEQRHGFGMFEGASTALMPSRNQAWQVLVWLDGRIIGSMIYRIHNNRETFSAYHFYYTEPMGRYKLLEWLARHVDQVKEIEVQMAHTEQPETWLADINPDFRQTMAPMGRVVDVMRLNDLPVHAEDGFTLHVSDPLCEWNNGTFKFQGGDGVLKVAPVEATTDDTVSIQGLSAIIYGTHHPHDFPLRGWGKLQPETQEAIQALFPLASPHLHERF